MDWKIAVGVGVLIVIIVIVIIIVTTTKDGYTSSEKNSTPTAGRKVLVLYTGGTIGMVETPSGEEPKAGFLEKQVKKFFAGALNTEMTKYISPYHIKEYTKLIDSSNATPADWNTVAHDIVDHYSEYDGFIVLHGTDTMAYTSSALSFALDGLAKPVVVTGSQIPLQKLKNDGTLNLLSALILASNYTIPEVMLVFNNDILRGNRAEKVSSTKLAAFGSPNFPPIGAFGYEPLPALNVNATPPPNNSGGLQPKFYSTDVHVHIAFLVPGMDFSTIKATVNANPNIRGVILRTFGIGNGPTSNPVFIDMLKYLGSRDIVILNIPQPIEGHVDVGDYETGKTLTKYKVISGNDMTVEAGYTKLLFLLSTEKSPDTVRKKLVVNMRGELSDTATFPELAPPTILT